MAAAAVLLSLWLLWHFKGGVTKVAFLNYQVIQLGEISRANDNPRIKLYELSPEDAGKAGRYDMLLINGMGLRITEAQREKIVEAGKKGLPVVSVMVTNPANDINTLDSARASAVKEYLSNGGPENYRGMLCYIRRNIDRKIFIAPSAPPPQEYIVKNIYRPGTADGKRGETGFASIKEYNAYLRENGLYRDNGPKVLITGQMGDAGEIIPLFEAAGNTVYAVRSLNPLLRNGALDSIAPAAVVNMAHGRLGDEAVEYLSSRNIPLFAPLNVNMLVSEWESDPMGMSGGFMSQSVVTPEIDGALRPFAVFGHYEEQGGLQKLRAIPGRAEEFVETVNNYISLKTMPERDKKIAVFYYKGAGQNSLVAAGLDVIPSLYNFLVFLREKGYNVDGLPSSPEALASLIQRKGAVFGSYAEGAASEFMQSGSPEWIDAEEYRKWVEDAMPAALYAQVTEAFGEFPGTYMISDGRLALARIELGNVVLLPQPAAGGGENDFQMVHGTHAAPPHNYIAAYLWARYGFGADAVIHFGTHGSMEFTPQKQVALSSYDWPDRLIGTIPHLYLYTIGNVGEGVIAKRRAYAGLHSYLTAPFMESGVRGMYKELSEAIADYNRVCARETPDRKDVDAASLKVKTLAVEMGINGDLGLDSLPSVPYTADEILRIENFAEELASEKVAGRSYVLGVPYAEKDIVSTVRAMSVEPVAYGLYELDRLRGKQVPDPLGNRREFNSEYIVPAGKIVGRLLAMDAPAGDGFLCRVAGITEEELSMARKVKKALEPAPDMMSMMLRMSEEMSLEKRHSRDGKDASGNPGMSDMMSMIGKRMAGGVQYSDGEMDFARAVSGMEQAVLNVYNYRKMLYDSPYMELESVANALDGGYTEPSPGGDPVANPNTLPTGRNLFAVNAEATPSRQAWEKGVELARNTIDLYRQRHNDSIPRKVSYTLWSSEFIETEGATVAQILYMLGVEPVYDSFSRVTDIRLIPSEELGRPRIDVVVQTSGQLRDIAASRLFLIDRAVRMAAASAGDRWPNYVAEGITETERILTGKGVTPKDARRMSSYRVFGGVNGNYGTGIQGMVQASGRWDSEEEIAGVYINNMGAYYGDPEQWQEFEQFVFEAALSRTDAVVQPRQSNTWGALSLDHVYEFMGGLNLAVREVTGKDPDAYLSDYRNRNRVRMQELKEAIGVESRTTVLNPAYIAEKMAGGAGDADAIAETVRNTFGWNVMKPDAVDERLWNEYYDIYVGDRFGLGVQESFERNNPAALQEITAVMLETVRKGYWNASPEQIAAMAGLHAELIGKYRPSCSGTVCDNAALSEFIASNMDPASASSYRGAVREIREAVADNAADGMVLRKESMGDTPEGKTAWVGNTVVILILVVLVTGGLLIRRRRRKTEE